MTAAAMPGPLYPPATPAVGAHRKELAPDINAAFETSSNAAFPGDAPPQKIKQLITVTVAHPAQCPYYSTGHP